MSSQLLKAALIGLTLTSTASPSFGQYRDNAAIEAQRLYDRQMRAYETERQAYPQAQPQRYQPEPQPRYQQAPPQQVAPANQIATNGRPVDPATGKPLSDAQMRLKEYREQPAQNMPVIITQPEWTPAIEAQYSAFVAKFGKGVKASPKRTIKSYMRDPNVNMYAGSDPAGVIYYSDCADLPYFLRSYFAFKNGLPMSIAADPTMSMVPYASEPNREKDLADITKTESSPYGNILGRRAASNIPSRPGREQNYLTYWSKLMDQGSTRTFRVGPLSPNYDLSDVYPVKIDNANIRPGTVVHSNGHILVVTEVLPDGTINAIDAHPDNSVQFKVIDSSNLERSRPDHGFGFFNFRPAKAVGGQWLRAPNGQQALYGAEIVTATDNELYRQGKWSMEQWFGPGTNVAPQEHVDPTAWHRAYGNIGFFDYVRTALSGSIVTKADVAAGSLMVALCDNLTQRVPDIAAAIDAKIPLKPRPSALPANIFNADGDWEAFSSPSRDSRSRQAILNLPRDIVQKFKNGVRNQLKLTYSGTAAQFQQAVVNRWALMDATCKATYVKSDGSSVSMNLSDMVRRAPRMSFDVYDCAEKRWGAQGAELQSCRDTDPSNAWYNAEQSMRNTVGKTDANENLIIRSTMPITLEMLQSGRYVDQPSSSSINLGASRSPLVDLKAYFASPQFLNDLSR